MTKRRRHTPEQVTRKLREGERLLDEGSDLATVCKHLEVSEQTWHRWRNQYGGMKAEDAKRLKELEKQKGPTPGSWTRGVIYAAVGSVAVELIS